MSATRAVQDTGGGVGGKGEESATFPFRGPWGPRGGEWRRRPVAPSAAGPSSPPPPEWMERWLQGQVLFRSCRRRRMSACVWVSSPQASGPDRVDLLHDRG